MTDPEFFNEVVRIIKTINPKVKVKNKKDVWYHKLISKILFFANYDRFSTTIGNTISLADGHGWMVLAHEGRHTLQSKKQGTLIHSFLYLFPQSLAPIFVILGFVNPLFLLGLVCLLPIPSYFRMKKELQAYRDSVILYHWRYGVSPESHRNFITSMFSGSSYYFMWPFKKYIRTKLDSFVEEAKQWKGYENNEMYLNSLYISLRRNGLFNAK